MKRTVYDNQFKRAVVKLVGTSSSTLNEVAKELGISTSSLRRWVNEYDEYTESAFLGHGTRFQQYILVNPASSLTIWRRSDTIL